MNVKNRVEAGGINVGNHAQAAVVRTGVKAGGINLGNHAQALLA